MSNDKPFLNEEYWNCTADELAEEIAAFVQEMGSFTPYHFIQIKFHLLKLSFLDQQAFFEFCEVAFENRLCPNCKLLYKAKECPLWSRLFRLVDLELLKRAPPCIKRAFRRHSIRTVVDYLTAAHLINPPFYRKRPSPSCKAMRNWNYCEEDIYCKRMITGNTLEYAKVREKMRRTGSPPRP